MTVRENRELNAMFGAVKACPQAVNRPGRAPSGVGRLPFYEDDEKEIDEEELTKAYCQWTTHDGKIFVPASNTKKALTPGIYEIDINSNIGLYFEKIPVKTEGLLRFPDTNSDKVLDEIVKFWESEEVFRRYDLTYKRGILLWGPPGSGKSCTCQLIMSDVVKRGGIVVKFDEPHLFIDGMRILRTIQPETPVVAMMEDIDAIIEAYNESEVLNILDGVNEVNKTVFLATTNYPDRLGARVVNRPPASTSVSRSVSPPPPAERSPAGVNSCQHAIRASPSGPLLVDSPFPARQPLQPLGFPVVRWILAQHRVAG